MSTRGAYGFYVNGQEKVTYNHFDSYPSELGNSILEFLNNTNNKPLREIALNIQLVDQDTNPTPEQIEECKHFADTKVSDQTLDDWYCLLRNTQGDLKPYIYGLKYMIDYKDFLYDSLFCEWAYIINLDEGVLEVYKGFNKDNNAAGRYAWKKDKEFAGVRLIASWPLYQLPNSLSHFEDQELLED